MVYSLFGIAIRNIRSNKSTMITAFISVALSIALITLIITFVSQAQHALIQDARNRAGGIDAFVAGEITPEYVQTIRNVDGVSEVLPIHQDNLDVRAEHNFDQQLNVYAIGTENTPIARSRYEYEVDILANQAVISVVVSEFLEVDIGEYIIIDDSKFEVIEIIGSQGSHFYGFGIVVISFDDFSRLIGTQSGNHLGIAFYNPGQTVEMLSYIRQFNDNVTITSIADALDEVENLSSIQIFVHILSAIVILACSFMVVSNFQSFLEKYRGQFSVMRSFGTSGKQLWKILFAQGLIVVGSGALVGVSLAMSLHIFVFRAFSALLSLAITVTLSIPMAVLIATIFSSIILTTLLIPAIQCSRVLPIQIVQEVDRGLMQKRWKNILGGILVGLAVFIFVNSESEYSYGSDNRGGAVIAILFYTFGFLFLFTSMIQIFLNITKKMLAKTSKGIADIAVLNMKNNLLTTRNIVFSIFFVFLVATFGGSMLQTINNNSIEHLKSNIFLDIAVSDILEFDSQLDLEFINELIAIEGFDNTVILSYEQGYLLTNNLDGMHYFVGYLSLGALIAQGELDMDIENLDNIAVITRHFSELHNLAVGSMLTIWYNPNLEGEWTGEILPITESFTFEVGAIIDELSFAPFVDIYIDWSNQILPPENFVFDGAFIRTNDMDRTIDSLYALRSRYPEIRWHTLESMIEANNAMFLERYGIFLVVLFLVILSLSLGVINTIVSGMYRRRKEYAVLRAIGTPSKDIAKTVYLQIFLYLLLGAFAGIINGGLFVVFLATIDHTNSSLDYLVPLGALTILSFLLFVTIGQRTSKLLKEDLLMQMNE
ncbi:MAG: ABC transporter permease [Defluviitaleaceae bacterium]|nr:ABC transporter permease [Defluviitaleaceae bacterium]